MKKIAFTVGAVTAVCACSLVIDPDKLVEGNASAPIDPGADGGGPDGDTGDASPDVVSADTGTDAPIVVEVPECVPTAPAGTEGPYAVTFGPPEPKVACPTGYLATPVAAAKGKLEAESVVCGSTTGCTCAAPSGTPTCSLRLRYFSDNQCTNTSGGSDPIGTQCADIESASYLKLETTVMNLTCTSNGPTSVAPTVKPTPVFREEWVVCAPDPNVQLAQCKMDQVGVPPAKDASACVIASGASCPSPYTRTIQLSKAGTFSDARACACSCGASPSSCTGGSATIFGEDTCVDTGKAFALDTCLPRSGDDGMKAVVPTPSGAPACTAKVAPTGSFSANFDLRLCCLP